MCLLQYSLRPNFDEVRGGPLNKVISAAKVTVYRYLFLYSLIIKITS